jgi:hypothetical protein
MKRSFLVVIFLCFIIQLSDAQLWKLRRWEASAGLGPSFSFPDIGGFTIGDNLLGLKDISYRQMRFDINGSVKYRLSRTLTSKISFTYAMLHATDDRGSNEGRLLESSTNLFEPAAMIEYYFVKNKYESSYLFMRGKSLWGLLSSLDFYAFTGFGAVSYSVKGNEALIERGMKEGGFCAVIPGGIGASLIYTPNVNFGLELGGRYAFTDYLDGYHSTQYSRARDVYYFLNFTVTYKLKTSPRGLPSFR